MERPTLRVSVAGIRTGTPEVGCAEEEGGDADDEDKEHHRRIGLSRSREESLVKENERKAEFVINHKTGFLLFVGNLPFKVSIRWLRITFGRFGNVIDVFISSKLSRGYGRRFGFVRFRSDWEAEQAIQGMDGTLIGKWNLIVQKAKINWGFSVPNQQFNYVSSSINSMSSRGPFGNPSPGVVRLGAGLAPFPKNPLACKGMSVNLSHGVLSHFDGKSGSKKSTSTLSGKADDIPYREVHSQADGSFGSRKRIFGTVKYSDWDLCAATALLRDGKFFIDMRSIILETCPFVRSVSLIKDNAVLLMFQSPYHRGLAIEHGLWNHWFYSVKVWSEGKVEGENRIWVECRGIPFCAWNEDTFEAIASVWGSIVEVDPETLDMVHLSSARFFIATNACAIDDIVELQVGDNIFDISVSCKKVQNNVSVNKKALSLRGHQQNTHVSRSLLEEHEQSTLLGNPSKKIISHCKSDSLEKDKVQSEYKGRQVNSSNNSDMYSADHSLQIHFVKKNLVPAGNALSDHSSISHVGTGMSNGCANAESSCMLGVSKSGDDHVILSHRGEAIMEPLGDVSVSRGDVVIQPNQGSQSGIFSDSLDCSKEVNQARCASGPDEFCVECSKSNNQTNLKIASRLGVGIPLAVDEGNNQCFNAEPNGVVNGCSKVSVGIRSDSELVYETEHSGDDQVMDSGVLEGDVINGSVSTLIMEYNKELVIPDKFSTMSGSLNISRAGFYAVCNRLIEVIDEILDLSSYMGLPFSIEAQKGIKDVMTRRQTRALSMIMDSL